MSILRQGNTGISVKTLQKLLIAKGYQITADGVFGSKTRDCVIDYQESNGLIADGIVGAATWSSLERPSFLRLDTALKNVSVPALAPISATSSGILQNQLIYSYNNYGNLVNHICSKLMIESASAHAVIATESAGSGFVNGRLKIRFENHVFYRYWGKYYKADYNELFRFSSEKLWTQHFARGLEKNSEWFSVHYDQNSEWKTFEIASALNEAAAIKSISMGAPQLMGFHYAKLGFASPFDMYAAFSSSPRNQILCLFDFICSDSRMITAIQEKDWVTFAYFYNGPGQPEKYGEYIRKRYQLAKELNI